jgi:hypothetical protein
MSMIEGKRNIDDGGKFNYHQSLDAKHRLPILIRFSVS